MSDQRMDNKPRASFWKSFGPGLLWAGASIGVSHLVQSTRAGATAGFGLGGVILLALILKYPFFEFGPRYAAATGQSLVEGYRRIGKWALWTYLVITILTSLIIQVAVVLFTAFIVNTAFGIEASLAVTGGAICVASLVLLRLGRFRVLDWTIKGVLALLAVSTLIAAFATLPSADFSTINVYPFNDPGLVEFAFLLALVGWMPTAFDLSVWSSLWTLAKDETEGGRSSVKNALLDFNVGYVGTGFLAFAFLILGATVMFGSGTSFDPRGTVFSTQLVDLYVSTLGDWTRPVVMTAVLTTMLSTSLTVIDGFPRAIDRSIRVLRHGPATGVVPIGQTYWIVLGILAVLTVVVLAAFLGNLTTMVDFATIVSFLTAPVLGYLNIRAIMSDEMPEEHRPGKKIMALAYAGLTVLTVFAVVYVVTRV